MSEAKNQEPSLPFRYSIIALIPRMQVNPTRGYGLAQGRQFENFLLRT